MVAMERLRSCARSTARTGAARWRRAYHRHRGSPRARVGAAVPAQSRRRRAVADRRQRRHQRGRPAGLQVRRDRALGQRHRGRGGARRAHPRGRPAAQGRGRLRPALAAAARRARWGSSVGLAADSCPRPSPRRSAFVYPDAATGCAAIEQVWATGWCPRRWSTWTRARWPPPRTASRPARAGAGLSGAARGGRLGGGGGADQGRGARAAHRRLHGAVRPRGSGRDPRALALARRHVGRGHGRGGRRVERGRVGAPRPAGRGDCRRD